MSRFLRTADDSDSSDSSSEEDDDSDASDGEGKAAKKKSRFLVGDDDEDESDEDVKRVVKSAKDKRLDEMQATGKVMDNALKINDWVAISNGLLSLSALFTTLIRFAEFDKLTRLVQRQTNVAERIPSFYIRTLASMEASLNNAVAKEKEAKKKMNASNARALTAMKQKIKKATKEYEKEIKQYTEVRGSIMHPVFILIRQI